MAIGHYHRENGHEHEVQFGFGGTWFLDWWYTYPLKNMKVSWDHYSIHMGNIKFMFQTTNQIIIDMELSGFFWIIFPTETMGFLYI
jgi:hypothetical protein